MTGQLRTLPALRPASPSWCAECGHANEPGERECWWCGERAIADSLTGLAAIRADLNRRHGTEYIGHPAMSSRERADFRAAGWKVRSRA